MKGHVSICTVVSLDFSRHSSRVCLPSGRDQGGGMAHEKRDDTHAGKRWIATHSRCRVHMNIKKCSGRRANKYHYMI